MNARFLVATFAALALAGPVAAQPFGGLPDEPAPRAGGASHEVSGVIGLVQKLNLPAPEAGVLTFVGVREGSRFSAEDLIAEIDSRDVKMAYEIAGYELKLAEARANDDIRIEFAIKQFGAEEADYDGVIRANQINPDTVPDTDVRREKLEMEQALASIKRAKKDKELAGLESNVKRAEMKAATIALEKRRILASFGGEVIKLERKEGEWVQPGDTIAKIVQLDTLQVDSPVYADEYTPREIADCRVTIRVDVGGDQGVVEAPGYITWVNPLVQRDGKRYRYIVRAEFTNRQDARGQWLINPGLPAKVTIHLGTQDETQIGRREAREKLAR